MATQNNKVKKGHKVIPAKMIRASGDVICEHCNKKYYDHPMDKEELSYDGRPFLHIGCDGVRLKL